ncbi:antitoxin Xre/MbcA/ParS toxin-binding domain-containing protein [Variovorax sp. KK3]|uniref:antitoxin Xre/MbcA/ParS toxin-binding domain-containing protein n=1 Tax=Variovorax sp. KK3 TaxID=1855728 RepID=UPI00097BC58C|nr:antitoxin Xre/MbcA/ParS toxin-binding domain-containing protein [Variovorax sp. KK3]
MARAFDRVFLQFLDTSGSRSRAQDHFFDRIADSCRLDRDKASHYASASMPAGAVDEWFKASKLPRKKDLQIALCLNASMLSRAHSEKNLEPVVTERMFRQADLLVRAAEVFGDEGPLWMTKPHPLLDGKSPAEYATNEFGGEKVRAILNAIEHGGVV